MTTQSATHAPFHRWLRVTAGLLVLGAILFAGGIALERGGHASPEVPSSHQEAGGLPASGENAGTAAAPEAHQDADQAPATPAVGATPINPPAESLNETVLGVNLENPWLTIAFVLGSLVLAAALLLLGRKILPLVILIASVATIVDVREVLFQIGRANTGIAIVAAVVALTHAVVLVLGILTWRMSRLSGSIG